MAGYDREPSLNVVVDDRCGVQAIGVESASAVFSEGDVGVVRQGNMIVVVQAGQLAKPQMARQGGAIASDGDLMEGSATSR